MDLSKHRKLSRLGRNLKVGDVIAISEQLDQYRSGYAEITGLPGVSRSYFSGELNYDYPIKVVSGEGFHSVVWSGMWAKATFHGTDRVELFRPKATA